MAPAPFVRCLRLTDAVWRLFHRAFKGPRAFRPALDAEPSDDRYSEREQPERSKRQIALGEAKPDDYEPYCKQQAASNRDDISPLRWPPPMCTAGGHLA